MAISFDAPLPDRKYKTARDVMVGTTRLTQDPKIRATVAFVWAIRNHRFYMLRSLLKYGADLNLVDGSNKNVLDYAVETENPRLIHFIVSRGGHGGITYPPHMEQFLGYVDSGDSWGCQVGLYMGKDRPFSKMEEAIHDNDTEYIKYLLTEHPSLIDEEQDGTNILFYGIRHGTADIVQLFLNVGVDPNKCLAVQEAVQKGNLDILTMVIEAGGDYKTESLVYDLYRAYGNTGAVPDIVCLIVEHYPLVISNHNIYRLLQYRRDYPAGFRDIYEILLPYWKYHEETECDYGWSRKYSDLPLLYQVMELGEVDIVRRILEAGPNLSVRFESHMNKSYLHFVAKVPKKNQLDIVRLLLSAGMDINAVDKHGNTLLHDAKWLDVPVVQYLIQQGANVDKYNRLGKKPLDHYEHLDQLVFDKIVKDSYNFLQFYQSPTGFEKISI